MSESTELELEAQRASIMQEALEEIAGYGESHSAHVLHDVAQETLEAIAEMSKGEDSGKKMVITYTKTQPDGEVEQVTATIVSRTNSNWTRAIHLDNGDEIRTHHASPPHLANDPYTKLEIQHEMEFKPADQQLKDLEEQEADVKLGGTNENR